MGRPEWAEIIKHLQLNGKSLKAFHFRVRTPLKSPNSELSGSTRLSLPVYGPVTLVLRKLGLAQGVVAKGGGFKKHVTASRVCVTTVLFAILFPAKSSILKPPP